MSGCDCKDGGNGNCKRTLPCGTAACEELSPSFDFFNKTFKCEFSNGDTTLSRLTQPPHHPIKNPHGDKSILVQCPLPASLQNAVSFSDAGSRERVSLVAPSVSGSPRERRLR